MGKPYRTEHDIIGDLTLPGDCLHGVHTARALENFPLSGRRPHPGLTRAYGAVKLAAAMTNRNLGAWQQDASKADAVAARVYATFADRHEGSKSVQITGDAQVEGWVEKITHEISTRGLMTTTLELADELEPLSVFSFMDPATRRLLLKLAQPGK